MKTRIIHAKLAAALAAALAAFSAAAYDLHNPALTPIKEKTPPPGGLVTLVRDGKPTFVVIAERRAVKSRSSVNRAFDLLREVFRESTGCEIEFADPAETNTYAAAESWIVLGDSAVARSLGVDCAMLSDQCFVVKTFTNGVIIAGNPPIAKRRGKLDMRGDSDATLFGTVDFVERVMGVRFYFPGKLGYIYPKCDSLVVSPVHYEDAPYFNTRGNPYAFYCATKTEELQKAVGEMFGGFADGVRIQQRWRLGGTMPLLGKHAPEPKHVAAFAGSNRLDKVFYKTATGRLYYSAENYFGNYYDVVNLGEGSFAELLIEGWKKFYDSEGTNDVFRCGLKGDEWINFGVTDVYLSPEDFVGDPEIRRLRLVQDEDFQRGDDRAIMANVYGRFYKHLCERISKELPGRKLFALAYYNCKYAPTRYKLPENFDAIVCDGSLLSFVMDPVAREKSRNLFKGWYDAMGGRPPSMAYLYGCGDPYGAAVTPEYIGEVVRALGPYLGRTGVFFDYSLIWNNFWCYYAAAHQQWNPDFDAVAAANEMFGIMFGPEAAPHLRDFHNRLRANCEKYIMPSLMHPDTPAYPLSEVDALETDLMAAKASLVPESVEARRLDMILGHWTNVFARTRSDRAKAAERGDAAKRNPWADCHDIPLRVSKSVDWSAVPEIPGTPGLKLVWDANGIHGRADGPIHYELSPIKIGSAKAAVDFDTSVPAFDVPFTKDFSGKAYDAFYIRPIGRIRLLGRGDRVPSPGVARAEKNPPGSMDGEIKTFSKAGGRNFTLSGSMCTYSPLFGKLGGDTRYSSRPWHWQNSLNNPNGSIGFGSYANWISLVVNGIDTDALEFGSRNLRAWSDGDRRGYEYALNFDGGEVFLRFYLRPGSSVLWGDLECGVSVTNAVLRINGIPSVYIADSKTAAMPYARQVRTASRLLSLPPEETRGRKFPLDPSTDKWFILQDGNYDGTANGKGVGPVWVYVEPNGVERADCRIDNTKREIPLAFILKAPLKKVSFGVWERRAERRSNDAFYNFLKSNSKEFTP